MLLTLRIFRRQLNSNWTVHRTQRSLHYSCGSLKEDLFISRLHGREIRLVQVGEIRNLQSKLRIKKEIELCKWILNTVAPISA
jgi:hypothetical protein